MGYIYFFFLFFCVVPECRETAEPKLGREENPDKMVPPPKLCLVTEVNN